jgi:5'-phosphate synthase pdxT subunit
MIGVLALQGGVDAHLRALDAADIPAQAVRSEAAIDAATGLVLPGGESSVQLDLLARLGLSAALRRVRARGCPVLATCAGLILIARQVSGPSQVSLGWLDVDVTRNGYGRQVNSFQAVSDDGRHPLVFIRAPRITRVGPSVTVRASHRGEPVLVQQGPITAASFHPELTDAVDIHRSVFNSDSPGLLTGSCRLTAAWRW